MGRYIKLVLIVPVGANPGELSGRVKKMPVVANFKPKNIELKVYPTKNLKFTTVEVILT